MIFGVLLPFWLKNISSSFQSGSQNDLVDSWRDESNEATGVSSQTTSEAISGANARWNNPPAPTSHRHLSAEYPFHKNLCMPPQGINFDLTHKRGEYFLNVIIHRGLRNDFFCQVTYFPYSFRTYISHLFPFSIWTFAPFIYLFFLDFVFFQGFFQALFQVNYFFIFFSVFLFIFPSSNRGLILDFFQIFTKGSSIKYFRTITMVPVSTVQPSLNEAVGLQIFFCHSDILSCITFYMK
jgi:hypothetical protein